MLFSIESLKEIFPQFTGESTSNHVDAIMLDSRKQLKNSLFIPIVGDRFNAHDFIEGAIEQGAVATIWDKQYSVPPHVKDKCYFFYVDDTVEALQTLAKYYRNEINPTVIGITGSNGKTTTKDILASVLETTYKTHKTAGNYNNDIGLPLTILAMPRQTEMLVLEMGMNDFGEIDLLTQIASPDYAIITNIGESHIEFLGSRAGIAEAKLEIINGVKETGTVVIDGDEALLKDIEVKQEVICCGFEGLNEDSSVITDVQIKLNATIFTVDDTTYEIPLTGAHHAKNATFSIMIAKKLGISDQSIKLGLKQIEYSDMRFEKTIDNSGAVIINDAYNASPTSMIGAIDVIKGLKDYKCKIIVLGDVFELGEQADIFHKQIGEAITKPINIVYTLGDHANLITETVKQRDEGIVSEHFSNELLLIESLRRHMNEDTIVLFKASRGMAFEKLIQKLIG